MLMKNLLLLNSLFRLKKKFNMTRYGYRRYRRYSRFARRRYYKPRFSRFSRKTPLSISDWNARRAYIGRHVRQ